MKKYCFWLFALLLFKFSGPPSLYGEATPLLTIGDIFVEWSNVFSSTAPSVANLIYKVGNKIHYVTQEDFIRKDLLFKEGDPYDPELIKESERILRKRRIFRYVTISTLQPQNGKVNVLIKTEDAWTTSLNLAFKAVGGDYFYRLGVFERNFAGRGVRVGGFIEQDFDRHLKGLSFYAPQIIDDRHEIFYGYGEDNRGHEWEIDIGKPYHSLRSKFSYGAKTRISDNQDRLFSRSDEVADFWHDTRFVRTFLSVAPRYFAGRANRFYLAHEYEEDRFFDFESEIPLPVPRDHTLSAVLIGWERRRDHFLRMRGIYTFDRDEDINLAWDYFIEGGPSLKALNASMDGAFGRARADKTVQISDRQFFRFTAAGESRYEENKMANGKLEMETRWIAPGWRPGHTAIFRGELGLSKNPDPEWQFLLGGENGLRGYPIRFTEGSKKIIFNAENRRLLWNDVWQLISVGWAVFFDSGAAWNEGTALKMNGLKNDVGAGIRFTPSRSVNAGIIRMDLAYALNDNNRDSRLVVNIGADLELTFQEKRKFTK